MLESTDSEEGGESNRGLPEKQLPLTAKDAPRARRVDRAFLLPFTAHHVDEHLRKRGKSQSLIDTGRSLIYCDYSGDGRKSRKRAARVLRRRARARRPRQIDPGPKRNEQDPPIRLNGRHQRDQRRRHDPQSGPTGQRGGEDIGEY